MDLLSYWLYDVLHYFNEIILYGAGYFATILYPELCQSGLKNKIAYVAVSKTDGTEKFKEFQIIQIDQIQCDKESVAVLVAVMQPYQDEVVEKVKSIGYKNIILGTDYLRMPENILRIYQGMNETEFFESIIRSYVYPKEKYYQNFATILEKSENNFEYEQNQIVYITGHLSPRNTKMINALSRKGLEIVVILYGRSCPEIYLKEIDGIKRLRCTDEIQLTVAMLKYHPLIYFWEPKWGDCRWVKLILQYKTYFRPIVLGLYDVLNDGYVMEYNEQLLESERYALEYSDGIVWRWYSKEYLEQKKKFVFHGKSIQFIDYCGNYLKQDSCRATGDSKILKLCTIQGSFWDFAQNGDVPNGYMRCAPLDNILDVLGNNERCILHIFIGRNDKKAYLVGQEIEKRYSNVKFFWNMNHWELIEKLQKYDYGCEFYNDGIPIPMDQKVMCGGGQYYGSTFVNCMGNKYFDYIDAGLPIIAAESYRLMEFLDQYGIVVHMPIEKFNIRSLNEQKEQLRNKAEEARKCLDIENHIFKLVDFFREVGSG